MEKAGVAFSHDATWSEEAEDQEEGGATAAGMKTVIGINLTDLTGDQQTALNQIAEIMGEAKMAFTILKVTIDDDQWLKKKFEVVD